MKYIRVLYGSVASVFAPLITYAQYGLNQYGWPTQYGGGFYGGGGGYATRSASFTNIEQIISLVQTLLGYAQVLIFLLAIGYFLYAAFLFVQGNVSGGRSALLYAIIGVSVGLFAFTIIPFLCWIFQATGGRACSL